MLIIDRLEDNFAVVEDGEKMFNIKLELIKDKAKEGDVLALSGSFYTVDKAATEKRRRELIKMLRKAENGDNKENL